MNFFIRTIFCVLYIIQHAFNQPLIRSVLDTDFYKFTMQQIAYMGNYIAENGGVIEFRNILVKYQNQNRSKKKFAKTIPERILRRQMDHLLTLRFTSRDIAYLRSLGIFQEVFLSWLPEWKLSHYVLEVRDGDYIIEFFGPWPMTILAETWVMSIMAAKSGWYEILSKKLNPFRVWAEADRQLTGKINKMRSYPNLRFAEFGTRRRHDLLWQIYVYWRLRTGLPNHKIITSNVWISRLFGTAPMGTFAHEEYMILAGLLKVLGENVRKVHNLVLDLWASFYEGKTVGGLGLMVALTDTFGSRSFFNDISLINLHRFGFRQDSGDPREHGYMVIDNFTSAGIDPNHKKWVASDGLDVDPMVSLHEEFSPILTDLYGVGTKLTNDMISVGSINYVVKAVKILVNIGGKLCSRPLVKLSDSPGKFLGPFDEVIEYLVDFDYPVENLPREYAKALVTIHK